MMYEVERRSPGRIDVPKSASLSKEAFVVDNYFSLSPQVRTRMVELQHPCKKKSYAFTVKMPCDGAMSEYEKEISEAQYGALSDTLIREAGSPLLTVSGFRRQYKIDGMALCVDFVDGLGQWNEIEKMVTSRSDIERALREIFDKSAEFGLDISSMTDKTYPEMIYENNRGRSGIRNFYPFLL